MKQGRADSSGSGSTKIEPRSHAVSPAYAGQLGTKMAYTSLRDPMDMGRGYSAPAPKGCTVHQGGSQGKHK